MVWKSKAPSGTWVGCWHDRDWEEHDVEHDVESENKLLAVMLMC